MDICIDKRYAVGRFFFSRVKKKKKSFACPSSIYRPRGTKMRARKKNMKEKVLLSHRRKPNSEFLTKGASKAKKSLLVGLIRTRGKRRRWGFHTFSYLSLLSVIDEKSRSDWTTKVSLRSSSDKTENFPRESTEEKSISWHRLYYRVSFIRREWLSEWLIARLKIESASAGGGGKIFFVPWKQLREKKRLFLAWVDWRASEISYRWLIRRKNKRETRRGER